ncbi:BLUF domain-containing protein [Asticcacaulis sp.]|uniref:BLUF domain-containing protein n=1 Tax=Asticcacaulis sp. TaxID=1872648 RepID=UPI003F7C9881
MLTQLIYHSQYVPGDSGALSTVRNILQTSEINNSRDGITGFLIFDKSHFLQILEGDFQCVHRTLERIKGDPRHRDLTVVADKSIEARAFTDWAMGGYVRSADSQAVYARHGIAGDLDLGVLTGATVVALALDLLAFETARQKERVVGIATHDPV